jgi:hypothetical protein
MLASALYTYNLSILAGNKDFSEVLAVPVNGGRYTLPNSNNSLIKKIDVFMNCSPASNNCLKFWDYRFLLLNRDNSITQNIAGIIQNPISGDWGNVFVKDSNTDFILSSKKSSIEFNPGIIGGGFTPRSISLNFEFALTANLTIRLFTQIQYETLTNSNI